MLRITALLVHLATELSQRGEL
ncbi:MAG: hypothetical protein JWM89_3426, partial [Acidimicrobiales bacterium]|nr:hypothetical protein [Acidimicrobiales bacterium]